MIEASLLSAISKLGNQKTCQEEFRLAYPLIVYILERGGGC
jgi:hypothetical protein